MFVTLVWRPALLVSNGSCGLMRYKNRSYLFMLYLNLIFYLQPAGGRVGDLEDSNYGLVKHDDTCIFLFSFHFLWLLILIFLYFSLPRYGYYYGTYSSWYISNSWSFTNFCGPVFSYYFHSLFIILFFKLFLFLVVLWKLY